MRGLVAQPFLEFTNITNIAFQVDSMAQWSTVGVKRLRTQRTETLPKRKKASTLAGPRHRFRLRYLEQVSLIIFRLLTRKSPCSFSPASFFSLPSVFCSSAFDRLPAEPVTVTVCPTWLASWTFLL